MKSDEELRKEILRWGAERYFENTRFFLDLGVKGVGIFYAILGGILSIYFARNTEKHGDVISFFLLVPLIISLSLGIVFFIGAIAWRKAAVKLNMISTELGLGVIPTLFFITCLIIALGILFIFTGIALWVLYCSFEPKAS